MDHRRRQGLRHLEVRELASRRCRSAADEEHRYARCLPTQRETALTTHSAGKDATEAFFGLHRHEVLLRPQYARLQIGTVAGQKEFVKPLAPGETSGVPYAEPAWLSPGFHSPYYNDNHRRFQKEVRKFFEEVVHPDAMKCEESGKRISQEVVDKLWCVLINASPCHTQIPRPCHSELNIPAMRIGPGKHLKGRKLMGGIVTPEEFDHFHEVWLHLSSQRVYIDTGISSSLTSRSADSGLVAMLTVFLLEKSSVFRRCSITGLLNYKRRWCRRCSMARNSFV